MLLHKVAIFCQNCYMTELTVTDVYEIGLPIIIAMMMLEALISQHQNKKYYKNKDTLCTSGLVAGNILVSLAIKGATLALHFYLYQFRVFDITNMIPVWLLWILTFVFIDLVFSLVEKLRKSIGKKGKLKYTKYFNSTLVAEFIINKTLDINNKNKYLWHRP